MRIIISPAKQMRVDTDAFICRTLPPFMGKTEILMRWIRSLSYEDKKKLWACNDKIAQKGVYAKMARGEMARYMAANVITKPEKIKAFDWSGYWFREDMSSAWMKRWMHWMMRLISWKIPWRMKKNDPAGG